MSAAGSHEVQISNKMKLLTKYITTSKNGLLVKGEISLWSILCWKCPGSVTDYSRANENS